MSGKVAKQNEDFNYAVFRVQCTSAHNIKRECQKMKLENVWDMK